MSNFIGYAIVYIVLFFAAWMTGHAAIFVLGFMARMLIEDLLWVAGVLLVPFKWIFGGDDDDHMQRRLDKFVPRRPDKPPDGGGSGLAFRMARHRINRII